MKPREFVQTLVSHGSFDDAALRRLGDLAMDFEKNGNAGGVGGYLKSVLPHVLGILGTSAVSGMIGYAAASKHHNALRNNLQYSRDDMLDRHEIFRKNPENFSRRFGELSLISPTVAANPELAHKVIEPKLHKGFGLEDIHRLAAIEHHSTTSQRTPHPLSVLTTESLEGLRRVLDFMAPTAVQFGEINQQLEATKDVARQYAKNKEQSDEVLTTLSKRFEDVATNYNNLVDDHDKLKRYTVELMTKQKLQAARGGSSESSGSHGGEEKKGSMESPAISEECVGVMLADRYVLYKKAGLFKTAAPAVGLVGKVGDLFKPSYNALRDHFKLIAVPLALGMGIQAVRQLMKQKETSGLRAQADETFDLLKRQNEYVRSNPVMASQAFDALRSFAPTLASKPLIAKTFIEHVIRSEQLPPQLAQELANTEEKVQQIAETTGGGGFIAGLQAPLSIFKFKIPEASKKDKDHRRGQRG